MLSLFSLISNFESRYMSSPFLSVVIPTRERADTLLFALQSCVNQAYQDVEFVVCNNASTDGTEALVQGFNDHRIRLINPGRRLSMRENWEFALANVAGKYVIFIGDDDALMPNALETLSQILATGKVDAVKWHTPIYHWLAAGNSNSGKFSLILGGRAAYIKSAAALRGLRWGYLHYHFLPIVYHGAVSMSCINRIKAKSGDFFCGESPDVYSAIAVASSIEKYIYLQIPLTINGVSRHSTGTSGATAPMRPGTPIHLFHAESRLEDHRDFVSIAELPWSLQACVTDAFLRARDSLSDRKLDVPIWYHLFLIVRELAARPDVDLTSPDTLLRRYSRTQNLGWLHDIYVKLLVRRYRESSAPGSATRYSGTFSFETEGLGVKEVYGAAILLDHLLRDVSISWVGSIVTTRTLLFGRLLSRFLKSGTMRIFKTESLS
jgi:glycosyltransferase involved in cell wall biosynthesis